jgi:ankyrin repeat protein
MRHVVRQDPRIRGLWMVACVVFLASAGCTDSPQQRLSAAVLRGDINTVASLLDDPHVDINWRHSASGSALGTAAAHGHMPIVQLLLQRGADPNVASDENMTPLHSAAYHGYAGIVHLLIDAGADVNATETRYGFTPLGYAARHGHIGVIRLLVEAGARQTPFKDGRTPIRVAEQYGQLDAANFLRAYGRSTDVAR